MLNWKPWAFFSGFMNNARRKKLIAVCRDGLLEDALLCRVDEPHGGITYGETADSSVNVSEHPAPFPPSAHAAFHLAVVGGILRLMS